MAEEPTIQEPNINDPTPGRSSGTPSDRNGSGGGQGLVRLLVLAGILIAVVVIAIVVANTDGDQDEAQELATEPTEAFEVDGGLGDPVVYRAGEGDEAWEVTVTAREVECGIDPGTDVEPPFDQFCAVHLDIENTGARPSEGAFAQTSVVSDTEGERYSADTLATAALTAEDEGDTAGLAVGEIGEMSLVFGVPDDVELALLHLQASADEPAVVVDLTQ